MLLSVGRRPARRAGPGGEPGAVQRLVLFLPDDVVTELETRAGGNTGGFVADVLRQTFERARALEAMDRMRAVPPERGAGDPADVAAEVVGARRDWAAPARVKGPRAQRPAVRP